MSYSPTSYSGGETPESQNALASANKTPEMPDYSLRFVISEGIITKYQWGLGIFGVLFLAYLLFLQTRNDITVNGLLRGFSDAFVLSGAVACTCACIYGALKVRAIHQATPGILTGRAWIAWIFMAASALVYVIGQAIWTGFDATFPSDQLPFPALYDPFYLLVYPFSWVGVILLMPRGGSTVGRTRLLLDAFIVVASVTAIFWYFILGPTIANLSGSVEVKIVALSYPLGDLSLCIAAAFLIFTPSGSSALSRPLGFLAIGVTLLAITDSLYAYGLLLGTYHTGLIQDLGWPLSWLFTGLSALCFPAGLQRLTGQHLEETSRPSNLSITTAAIRAASPMLIALVTCALLITQVALTNANLLIQVILVCAGIFLLPVIRQVLTLVDNLLLNERLRTALSQSQRAFQQSQQTLLTTASRAELYEELRVSIQDLQSTHARLARGDLKARATVEGPLAPAAQSLNLLIERMSRWAQLAHVNQEMEQEATQVATVLDQLSEGRINSTSPQPRSTHATGRSLLSLSRLQQRLNIHFGRLRELTEHLATQERSCLDVLKRAEQAIQEQSSPENKLQIAREALSLVDRRLRNQEAQFQELYDKSSIYQKPGLDKQLGSGQPVNTRSGDAGD